jgi:hypothetical protein
MILNSEKFDRLLKIARSHLQLWTDQNTQSLAGTSTWNSRRISGLGATSPPNPPNKKLSIEFEI